MYWLSKVLVKMFMWLMENNRYDNFGSRMPNFFFNINSCRKASHTQDNAEMIS